jgi:hypothetical protein
MLLGKDILASTNDLVAVPTLSVTASTELDTAALHIIKHNYDISSLTFG